MNIQRLSLRRRLRPMAARYRRCAAILLFGCSVSVPAAPDPTSLVNTRVDTEATPVLGSTPVESDPEIGPTSVSILDYPNGPILNDAVHGPSILDEAWTPMERVMAPLIPRQTSLWGREGESSNALTLQLQPGIPLVSSAEYGPRSNSWGSFSHSRYSENQPEIKAGPFYLDLASLSFTGLYSDLHGHGADEYPDDGFIAALEADLLVYLRLGRGAYLSAAITAYYLPTENRAGFYFRDSNYSFARLQWESGVGDWRFRLYDEFRVLHRLGDLLDEMETNEIAESGRYRLGRLDQVGLVGHPYFDEELIAFRNTVGFEATRPIGHNWRLWTDYTHADYWQTTSFENHRQMDRGRIEFTYEGDWRFMPYVAYTISSPNQWEGYTNDIRGGVRGVLSERIDFDVFGGYAWQKNISSVERDGSALWGVSLTYKQTEYLRHGLSAGTVYWYSDFGESFFSSYERYSLTWALPFAPLGSLDRRTQLGLYVQHADTDYDDQDHGPGIDSWQYGGNLHIPLGDKTALFARAIYYTGDGNDPVESERWLYRVGLERRIGWRTLATAYYQHERLSRVNQGLDEDLFMLQVTRSF